MLARHGGGSEARQAGVALADIAARVQHADLNTTRKALHRAVGRDIPIHSQATGGATRNDPLPGCDDTIPGTVPSGLGEHGRRRSAPFTRRASKKGRGQTGGPSQGRW
jgi:hypothetical protein